MSAETSSPPASGQDRGSQTAILMSARLFSMGLLFLAGIITARIFEKEVRAEYALLTTVAAFVSTFANLGFAEAIIYFFRRGDADERTTHTTIAIFGLGISVVVALLGIAIVPWLARAYFPTGGATLAWMALAAGLLGVFQRNALAFAQARHRFRLTAVFWTIQPVLFISGLLVVAATGPDITRVAFVFVAAWAVPSAALWATSLRRMRLDTLNRTLIARVTRFSIKSQANVAVNQLNYRLDMFIVAAVLPDLAPLADYHIAASLAGLIWLFPDTYGVVIYPRLASYQDERSRTRETVFGLRLVVLGSLVAAAGLAGVGPWLIPTLFGAIYADAVPLLWMLLPGVVLMSGCKILSRYLLSRNRHQWSAYCSLVGVAVNVTANLLLIPRYGITGAAAAAVLAYTATALGMLAATLRLWDFDPSDWHNFPRREVDALRRLIEARLASMRNR